ncbi:chemotaxis protein CheW [Altericista sp. CCNU0014]|uniref:chemotaxis protein CheW n=1 Tax=Altericista sp. CCNU0014 TaxID=3082949 RepID=UPI003851741B
MNTSDFLMFRLRQLQYGIPVSYVREIFPLPEINPVPEAPGDIIGLLNWRGKVLPVMHLDRRLGYPMQSCRLSDSVIVIEWQGLQVGVIVDRVEDVLSVEESAIDRDFAYGRENHVNTAFLAGVAKLETKMLLLLNADALIRLADEVAILVWESQLQAQADGGAIAPNDRSEIGAEGQIASEAESIATDFYALYCPDATVADRAIFQRRAEELKQSHEEDRRAETIPIAVLGLGGEYFGLKLDAVREFVDLPKVHPIPCCPTHILGNLNLRGEVVTLIDIKTTLNLKSDRQGKPKVAIAQVGEVVAGIAIDDVWDILYINEEDLLNSSGSETNPWIQGVTPYQNKMVSILNLPHLFQSDTLSVNESI